MRKITAILLSILMVLGLTACGNSKNSDTTSNSTKETEAKETTAAEDESESGTENSENSAADAQAKDTGSTDKGNKILVVYYSATGNTERVAKDIASALNADTFQLEPKTPYTDEDLDWTANGSRVNKEHDDESLRDIPLVKDTADNWDEYTTVLIGYPIWWGIAAWPVNEFVKNNDFTDKTVIPFATSSSSGLGESGTLLEKMAGTGNWQDGQRFSSGALADDVTKWAKGLGLE